MFAPFRWIFPKQVTIIVYKVDAVYKIPYHNNYYEPPSEKSCLRPCFTPSNISSSTECSLHIHSTL